MSGKTILYVEDNEPNRMIVRDLLKRTSYNLIEAHDAKVVIDTQSLAFLEGSTLDFVKEGLKQIFKFENPNVDGMCGCGESFSVKEKA